MQGAWSPAVCWTVCPWHYHECRLATHQLRTRGRPGDRATTLDARATWGLCISTSTG
jgi:hypothetical protein